MEEKLYQIFVGKKYQKLKKKVFSFPAFFFGALYFAYRKMIVKAFILSAILTLLDILTIKYATGGMLILTYLCIHISIGLYFPLWYRSFYTKSVKKIIEKNPNASDEDLTRIALNQGGTNVVLVILFFVLSILLSILFNSHINKPELPGTPIMDDYLPSDPHYVESSNNENYSNNASNTSNETNNELTGEANILTNQKVTGYASSMGEYFIYLLDFNSSDYSNTLRVGCDESTHATLSILKDYDEDVKVEVRVKRDENNISITSYRIFNAHTNDEIKDITDEDSLRTKLGLKVSGDYEETLILKANLNNAFGTPGAPAVGVENGNGYVEYTYSFEDENGNVFPLDYRIYNGTENKSEELIEGNKYKIKYTVEKGTFGYEFNLTSFELIEE